MHFKVIVLFTNARKRSLWQGYIFTTVCHSVQRGEYLDRDPPDHVHPPDQVHPPGQCTTPRAGTPRTGTRYTPQTRYTPDQVPPLGPGTPPDRYNPWDQVPSDQVPPPEQCMLGDTGNKRAVRILLECIPNVCNGSKCEWFKNYLNTSNFVFFVLNRQSIVIS